LDVFFQRKDSAEPKNMQGCAVISCQSNPYLSQNNSKKVQRIYDFYWKKVQRIYDFYWGKVYLYEFSYFFRNKIQFI